MKRYQVVIITIIGAIMLFGPMVVLLLDMNHIIVLPPTVGMALAGLNYVFMPLGLLILIEGIEYLIQKY